MLTKLLLTVGVIVLLVVAFRSRGRNARPGGRSTAATKTPEPASPTRITAWILIAVILVVSIGMGIAQRWSKPETVTVRVINTNTGEGRDYQVAPDQAGTRRFETPDGRIIIIADVERVELSPEAPPTH